MEETRAIVREARDSLRVRADSLGFQFVLVGVGLDWDPSVSFEHLSSVSAFDEIGAGYNWANSFALRFLWGEWAGRASVPQIIVMTRVMVRSDTTWAAPVVEVRNEEMVARKIGVEELKTWRSNGFSVNLGAEEDPSLLGGKQG